MPKLRVHNFAISLDGYGAGPDQSLDTRSVWAARRLHEWMFETRIRPPDDGRGRWRRGHRQRLHGRGDAGIGATSWGATCSARSAAHGTTTSGRAGGATNPPYHHPVFVLTHHPRAPITMEGGTTFHFVDDGIEAALERALDAADGKDVRLGGGASTIQQYLRAGLSTRCMSRSRPCCSEEASDSSTTSTAAPTGYECVEFVSSPSVVHVRISRTTT